MKKALFFRELPHISIAIIIGLACGFVTYHFGPDYFFPDMRELKREATALISIQFGFVGAVAFLFVLYGSQLISWVQRTIEEMKSEIQAEGKQKH